MGSQGAGIASGKQRTAIVLSNSDELPQKEIAEIMKSARPLVFSVQKESPAKLGLHKKYKHDRRKIKVLFLTIKIKLK